MSRRFRNRNRAAALRVKRAFERRASQMDSKHTGGRTGISGNGGGDGRMAAHVATVGIVGRTNGGKSTLLNRIVGEKVSIVSPVVQTTRNSIRAILDERRGQLVFTDTPGLHKAESRMGNLINKMARHAAANVEMLVVVFDVSVPPQLEDEGWMRRIIGAEDDERPVFFFFNKCDREGADARPFAELWDNLRREAGSSRKARVFSGSAATGDGVEKLVSSLFDVAPAGERLYPPDILSDYPRQLAIADIVREKIFLQLRDELPHSVGVRIDRFSGEGPKWLVEATLLVARPSQKPIVIGPGGRTVRRIRDEARRDIEEQYGVKVSLDIWVKVDKDWTTNPVVLRQMGYMGEY